MEKQRSFGDQLRDWRQRRHLSQLDLAAEVNISTRHLSFVETGRSQPSRAMVLRLAERLDVPLRERNALLTAAGYAPMYSVRPLSDPALSSARAAVDLILSGHEPYPALLVDRHWTLVAANRAVGPMLAGIDPRCSRRRSTCCARRCIRKALRRASRISRSGAHMCLRESREIWSSPRTRCSRSCCKSCVRTR